MVEVAVKEKPDISQPGALALADQAVHLLRRRGRAAMAGYLTGTLPFLLGLLYFWSDMSRSPDAGGYCSPAAAGVALLFVWMKFWHVRFCRELWCILQDTAPEKWSLLRSLSTTARQALLHATGLLVLPLASAILFPFGWVYAFYQNLSVMDGPDTKSLEELYKAAGKQSLFLPGQNHLLISLLSGFGLFVWANVAMGLMLLPHLFKILLGIETAFTISGYHAIFNTTFLAITTALTYLCVDPIIKAAYTLRCFYGHSRQTGDDLRADLKPFLIAALLALLLWPSSAKNTSAETLNTPPPVESPAVVADSRPDALDDAIDRVLSQRRFAWRMPGETQPEPDNENGWLWATLRWLKEKTDSTLAWMDSWLEGLSEWLQKILPDKTASAGKKHNWTPVIKIIFYAVGGMLILLLLLAIGKRLGAHRSKRPETPGDAATDEVDLNDETVMADALPREGWLAMAREMATKGELRTALRAYYLAILSLLGDRGRIAVARYKSNRDYLGELSRRSHADPELLDLFARCMASFECAWYGMHLVTEDQLHQLISDQERISLLVEHAPAA